MMSSSFSIVFVVLEIIIPYSVLNLLIAFLICRLLLYSRPTSIGIGFSNPFLIKKSTVFFPNSKNMSNSK